MINGVHHLWDFLLGRLFFFLRQIRVQEVWFILVESSLETGREVGMG